MPDPSDISSYRFFKQLTQLPFVEAICLYGSRARGDADDWSDIDLAVICPQASSTDWATIQDVVNKQELLIPVNVTRYDALNDIGFKAQIDAHKKELFSRHG